MTTRTVYPHVTFILCLLIVNNCWAEYDLDAKFDEINEKLDILIEQEVQSTGNASGVNTSDGSGPEQGTGDDDGDVDVLPVETGLEVVEIRRESLGNDEILFIIKYRSSVDFVMRVFDFEERGSAPVKQQKLTRTDDVQETSYLSRASNLPYDRINLVYYLEEKIYVHYELSKYVNADNLTTDVVPPVLGAAPAGDFVYEDGKNVTIKLRVPFQDGHDPNFRLNIQQVNEERDEIDSYVLEPDDVYDILEVKNESDSQVLTVRLNTVQYNSGGFVTATVRERDDSETALVKAISLGLHKVLRPSSQAGPLPEGFLGFQVQLGIPTVHRCSADSTCGIDCVAFGEDITGLSVYRLESNGLRTRIGGLFSDVYTGIKQLDYVRTLSGHLPPYPEETGTVEYQCVVENAQGVTRTQTLTYTYTLPLKIDQDRSGVHILNENDSSTIRRLAVVCSARGYPQPNITFGIQQSNFYGYDIAPDEIVENGNNEYTATKFVTFDTSDPNGLNKEYNGKLEWVDCRAETNSPEGYFMDYDSYYMESITDYIGK